MFNWILDGLKGILDPLINLLFGGIGTWFDNLLLNFLNFVLEIIIGLGFGAWNSPLITLSLVFMTSLCTGMWVVSIIFVLGDVLEDLHNGNPIPVFLIFKNIITGFLFATMVTSLSGIMMNLSVSIVNSMNFQTVSGDWNSVQHQLNSLFERLLSLNGGNASAFTYLLFIVVTIVASIGYLYYSFVLVAYNYIHSITGVLYVKPVTQGDSSAMGFWFKTSISYNLGFIIQTYLFKCAVALILSTNGVPTDPNTFLGGCFIIGMFITPRALGKYGITMGISNLGRSAVSAVGSVSRAFAS